MKLPAEFHLQQVSNPSPHDTVRWANYSATRTHLLYYGFVCVEVLLPSQPNKVMLSAVSLPNHTFTGQA